MARIPDLTDEQLVQQQQRYLKLAANDATAEEKIRNNSVLKQLRAEISKRSNQLALHGGSSSVSTSGEVDVYFDEGIMALKSGRHDEAEKAFLVFAKRNPKSTDAWSGLAICKLYQLANGRTMEEVMFAFARAKQVQPNRTSDVDRLVIEHASQVVHAYYTVLSQSVAAAKSAQNKAALGGLMAIASVVTGMNSDNTFVQLASLGAGGAGVGIALNGFSTISDIKVLQTTVLGLIFSIQNSVDDFVDKGLPEYGNFKKLLEQMETPNKRGRKPLLFANGERHVDFWLGLGIMFMPYVFAWFTLRDGHTKKARVISFVWLGFFVLVNLVSIITSKKPH